MDSSLRLSSPDLCTLPSDLAACVLDFASFICRLLPLKVPPIKIFSEIFLALAFTSLDASLSLESK